jgi:hypothetical protein
MATLRTKQDCMRAGLWDYMRNKPAIDIKLMDEPGAAEIVKKLVIKLWCNRARRRVQDYLSGHSRELNEAVERLEKLEAQKTPDESGVNCHTQGGGV